jgi:hypothetical protein
VAHCLANLLKPSPRCGEIRQNSSWFRRCGVYRTWRQYFGHRHEIANSLHFGGIKIDGNHSMGECIPNGFDAIEIAFGLFAVKSHRVANANLSFEAAQWSAGLKQNSLGIVCRS